MDGRAPRKRSFFHGYGVIYPVEAFTEVSANYNWYIVRYFGVLDQVVNNICQVVDGRETRQTAVLFQV